MTAEATLGAARTGFHHALVSTPRHPNVDEPALAIPNGVDDCASTRHPTRWPMLKPMDGASCQGLNLLGQAQRLEFFLGRFRRETSM